MVEVFHQMEKTRVLREDSYGRGKILCLAAYVIL